MKPSRIAFALLSALSMALLGLLIAWIIHRARERRPRAENPQTYCGIFGSLVNPRGQSRPADFGDMIRLRFEVDSVQQCKDVAKNYCQEALADGYRVRTLTLVYRPANAASPEEREERYTVDADCGIGKMLETD